MIDLSIDQLDKTYSFLGELLNQEEVCKTFSDYLSGFYTDIHLFLLTNPFLILQPITLWEETG